MMTNSLLRWTSSCRFCTRRAYRSFTKSLHRWTLMMVVILNVLLPQQALGEIVITSPKEDEITVQLGETLFIQCMSTEATPIKWSYNGMVLETDDRIRTHTDSAGRLISTLTIMEVSDVEQGRYQCTDSYFDRDELNVLVHTSQPPQTVRIVEPDGNELRTPTDGTITLKCVGEEGSSIRWLHNDIPIHSMGSMGSTGSRLIITTSKDVEDHKMKSLLSRRSVTSLEDGYYTCQDLNNPLSKDTVRVTVLAASENDIQVQLVQPTFSLLPVDLGSSFTLRCRGDIQSSLGWYVNNTLWTMLSTPPTVRMTEQEGKSKMTVLTVDEATYSDSGLYSCRNDRDVNDKDEVTVRVRHPVLQSPADDVEEEPDMAPTEVRRETLRVGSPMKLQCSLEATADHVTEWYKDDRKLISGGKFVIKESGAAELYIPNTDRNDVGVYRCTFLNRDTGAVIANILFNLTTIPCQPLSPPQNGTFINCPEDPVYGDFCTFHCNKGFRLTDKRPVICDRADGPGQYVWNRATPKCIGLTPDDLLDSVPTSLSHVLLRVGSNLKLVCNSGSSWMKGGTRLANSDKYTIEEHALIIKNTKRGDTGIYDCNVVREEDYTLKGIKKFNVTTLPCPKLPVLGNGSMDSCSKDPMYGETCVFKCERGYKLIGGRSKTCELAHAQSRAYWTGNEKPTCIRDNRSNAAGHTSCASHSLFSQTLMASSVAACIYTMVLQH